MGLALLSKDTFKETLYDVIGSGSEKEQLVEVSALRLVEALAADQLCAGVPVIIESNFDDNDVVPLKNLLVVSRARALQLYCDLPDNELVARFRERAAHGQRHPGHGDAPEDAEQIRAKIRARTWEPLDLDGTLERIDTRDDDAVARALAKIETALAQNP